MTMKTWVYPNAARYHSAMASLISSEANLEYFMQNAARDLTNTQALRLVQHNVALYFQEQATAIAWASMS
jgi:hypothetical protein